MNPPRGDEDAGALFDEYAGDYDRALQEGLSVSGEGKDYFARGRIAWVHRRLRELSANTGAILDFGCGTGSASPFIHELLRPQALLGVDVSARSIEHARQTHGSPTTRFEVLARGGPENQFDLAYCNGVFHHIPLADRPTAVGYVLRALRPGGLFAFWENNPWNPGTRYVMSRIPFDRDAITLSPPTARGLLQAGGFGIVRTDFLFIFPRALKWLRGLEPAFASWPIGAQYLVLARKP